MAAKCFSRVRNPQAIGFPVEDISKYKVWNDFGVCPNRNINLDPFGLGLPGFFLSISRGDSPLHLSNALKSDPVLELFNRVLADQVPGMEHTQSRHRDVVSYLLHLVRQQLLLSFLYKM